MQRALLVLVAAIAAIIWLISPAFAAAQADSGATFQTRNGPRTMEQLEHELAAAGYVGPWDSASMLAAYERAAAPSIDPYPSDTSWSCLPDNRSCQTDPWWAEWNALQDDTHVTYSAIGSHFISERRFAEAIDLLWQWPEGKSLLRQADATGVLVISLAYDRQVDFATYSPQRKLVAINNRFTTAPTWMEAGVIAHELSHAADAARGVNQDHSTAACLAGETAAFQVQQRFLVWLTRSLEPDGLPSVAAVSARLSSEQAELAQSLFQIGLSSDIPDLVHDVYGRTC
jgi:hypothetical protein